MKKEYIIPTLRFRELNQWLSFIMVSEPKVNDSLTSDPEWQDEEGDYNL